METNLSKSKRIAKNTIILYFRMVLLMAINLYVSRVVLDALGVEDFGVYHVVGGFVALFSIFSGSLGAAISRFITFELGKKNEERLREIFSASVTVQLFLILLILFLCETIGLWFFNAKMEIPSNRVGIAFWCFQFSIITFAVNLLSVPYNACIIAHEKMSAFAYIGLLEGLGRLLIAWGLLIYGGDKLFLYALMLMILSVSVRLIYGVYCKKNFSECKFSVCRNRALFKEIFAFSGWNFIGAATDPLCFHGRNILLNLFFGPALNAAYGLAMQVNSAVHSFSSNFMTAIKPQIIKTYAEGDKDYLYKLLFWGAKLSFFPLVVMAVPIIFNVEFVLNLWLKNVPDYTPIFVILTLVNVMSESISQPLVVAMLATGKIRNYQIVVGGMALMNVPAAYVWLRCGGSPICIFIVSIVISQLCFYLRLYMLRGMISLPVKEFFFKVYVRAIFVLLISLLIPYVFILNFQINHEIGRFIGLCMISLISSLAAILFVGCSWNERIIVVKKIREIKKRF